MENPRLDPRTRELTDAAEQAVLDDVKADPSRYADWVDDYITQRWNTGKVVKPLGDDLEIVIDYTEEADRG